MDENIPGDFWSIIPQPFRTWSRRNLHAKVAINFDLFSASFVCVRRQMTGERRHRKKVMNRLKSGMREAKRA